VKNILTIIVFFLLANQVKSQKDTSWQNMYGSNKEEVKEKLTAFIHHYNYENQIYYTDTTIEMMLPKAHRKRTMYFIFYFDKNNLCNSISNTMCDSLTEKNLDYFNKNYRKLSWNKIGENKYLSNYREKILLEIFTHENCLVTIKTKLNITRKEYKAMLKGSE